MAYVVKAVWHVAPDRVDQVVSLFQQLAPLSRQEPGNLVYEAYRDPAEPTVITLFEKYADQAAFDAHLASEHFQNYALAQLIPLLEGRERSIYESLD